MKKLTMLVSALALSAAAVAAPASASPQPNPTAPAHTGTACATVLEHNPQAGPETHSAPQAQANFGEVGAAFCGL